MDVFDMFGDDESSDRTALATAPERESTDNGTDHADGPGRRSGRRVLALVVAGVLVAGMIGAASWAIGRGLSSDQAGPSCSSKDRADQEKLRDWLQLHVDAGLAGQNRDVVGTGCAPGEATPGAWVAIVDGDELKGIASALNDADCTLTGPDLTRSSQGKQTCQVVVDGLKATLTIAHADESSPYGDYQLTVLRSQTPAAA